MEKGIHLHDVVALLEEGAANHFESGQPLHLHRGQIGTLVKSYTEGACEVEFADRDGRAYAILPVQPDKLIDCLGAGRVVGLGSGGVATVAEIATVQNKALCFNS
jgi:hypothetical protein